MSLVLRNVTQFKVVAPRITKGPPRENPPQEYLRKEPQPVPPKAGETSVFTAMLYIVYQALTGISDQIETISVFQFVPSADLKSVKIQRC